MKKTRQPAPEGLIELQRFWHGSWESCSRDFDRVVMETRFQYAAEHGDARLVDLFTGEILQSTR